MQGIEQGNGNVDGYIPDIVQFRPVLFLIGLEGGCIFRETNLKPAIGVDMAIGDMVDHLLYGPAAFPVWGQQLRLVQVEDGILQQLWQEFNIVQPGFLQFVGERLWLVFADGIAEFFEGWFIHLGKVL
jgi:hypothetical protein